MSHEDYYKVLGVSRDAALEDIKKAYRRLALETHPDRNSADPLAEERFKKVNEAYGVLGDAQKRAQYDQYRNMGFHGRSGPQAGPGFGFSQEDILRDFFTSRQTHDLFREMQREFQRMGFRFDESFINGLFFGGRQVFFRGVFMGGPSTVRIFRYGNFGAGGSQQQARPGQAGPGAESEAGAGSYEPPGLLRIGLSLLAAAGKKIGSYLLSKALELAAPDDEPLKTEPGAPAAKDADGGRAVPDITYQLAISKEQAISGGVVEVIAPHLEGGKRLSVRIPPGVQTGAKLRLKGMGNALPDQHDERGDLYLQLKVS